MVYLPPKKPVGYCKLKRWKLSMKQIRRKGCIDPKKQCRHGNKDTLSCRHFRKYEHPIWNESESMRKKAKQDVTT